MATAAMVQWLWDIRYIDAPILRWRDADNDENHTLEETLYFCNDANMNVTALVNASSGNVVERYVYDPYGKVTIYDDDWSDTVAWANSKKNEILYCGYRWDPESGLYHVRHRYYHPTLGRFVQRDQAGYQDGANLCEYGRGAPQDSSDPYGLSWAKVQGQDNVYEAELDGESLVDLATMDGVNDSGDSWVCIQPKPDGLSQDVQQKMREFYDRQQAPACGRYDVGNLTDAWPQGADVAMSVFTKEDPTGHKMIPFLGGKVGGYSANAIAIAAGRGSTPIGSVVLMGHSRPRLAGMAGSRRRDAQVYRLEDFVGNNLNQGSYASALGGVFPAICWFRHDAVVRLSGCHTDTFAQAWARVLRRGAVVIGTTEYINWTPKPAGRSRPYFGKDGKVHDTIPSFYGDPHWREQPGEVW